MKKNRWKKMTTLLAVSCMLLTGCGTPKEAESKEDSGQAMGRYMEHSLELTDDLGPVCDFTRLGDERLAIVSLMAGAFVSEDEGKTWQNWLTEGWEAAGLYNGYSSAGAIAPDGTVFIQYQSFEETNAIDDGSGESEEAGKSGESGESEEAGKSGESGESEEAGKSGESEDSGEAEEGINYSITDNLYHVFLFPDGTVEKFPVNDHEGFLTSCTFSPDGRLYAGNGSSICEVSPQDGSRRPVFEPKGQDAFLRFSGQKLLVFGTWGMQIYDLEQKEPGEADEVLDTFIQNKAQDRTSLVNTGGNSLLMADVDEDGTVYLACSDGIYRHSPGGGTMEMLVDGNLNTLGDISASRYGMLAENNEFLILFGNMLASYVYDPLVPSVPEKTLKVYGLTKDDCVRQAVSLFQKAHQDVYVEYEEGLANNSGQTQEDAVKNLNTEILAGKGPDVILLDGLPADSYMEKGLLQDLTPLMASLEKECFGNMLKAFQKDEKVYALPVKVQIPLMVGDKEELSGVTDLQALAGYVNRMREAKPAGTLIQTYRPEETLRVLALTSAPAWTDASGNIQEDKVREFLQKALEIYTAEKQGITEQDLEELDETNFGSSEKVVSDSYLNTAANSLNSYTNDKVVSLGRVGAFQFGFTNVISVVRGRDDLWWGPMAGQTEHVFTPTLIAGISSGAAEKELAEEFLKVLLSQQNQEQLSEDFPVNREALINLLAIPEGSDGTMGNMTLFKDDGTYTILDCYYPDEEECSRLIEIMENVRIPCMAGSIVEEAVIASGVKVLNGETDVETGLSQIREAVQLYLAE